MSIFEDIFKRTQNHILQTEDRNDLEYDCYLSGGVTTIVVIKDEYLYCANIGNVNAAIFFNEKAYTFKFKVLELTIDNSAVMIDECNRFHNKTSTVEISYDCKYLKFLIKYILFIIYFSLF